MSTTIPLIFLLRRSSEGLHLSHQELTAFAIPSRRNTLPTLAAQAAQIVQDFGSGALLLWPLLNFGKDLDKSWGDPPRILVFLSGAALFALGWFIRRFASPSSA